MGLASRRITTKPRDVEEAPPAPIGRPRERAVAPDPAGPASSEAILQLQRDIGNEAVVQMLRRQGETGPSPSAHDDAAGRAGAGAVIGREGGTLDAGTDADVQRAVGAGGKPLDETVRRRMEPALGADLSGVKVHTDTKAAQLSRTVSAVAFTTGRDIFFGAGAYQPGTAKGDHLLAHELTHVAQQTPGIQRRFLDSGEDWVGGSSKKGTFGKKSRSKALKAVDRAVAGWVGLGPTATAEAKKNALLRLQAAIATWRSTKDGEESIRDPEIGVLVGEVNAELNKIDRAASEKLALERAASEKAAKEKAAQERVVSEKAALEKAASEKAERERLEAERLEAEKAEAARVERERLAAEKLEQERLAAEKLKLELDKTLKPWGEIDGLSMEALAAYVKLKPNWHERSTLTDPQRALVRKLEPYGAKASCQAFVFHDMAALGTGGTLDAALVSLDTYIAAVQSNTPFSLTKAPTVAAAVGLGKELAKLSAAFPAWVLKTAINDKIFRWMMASNLIEPVVRYYTTSVPKPIFQAENGSDFISFGRMVLAGKDPLSYQSTVLQGKIRNFHRFLPAALDQLVANYADRSKTKPLTLILHASIDHNGAFHRDPLLSDVITNTHINALMIEGGETLSAFQSEITPLAEAYGMNKKVDQVMFAGHGNSRLMQMAGTVEEGTGSQSGKLAEKNDMIDLDRNKVAADALFDEVLKNMDPKITGPLTGTEPAQQVNRRILFNACLTNSNAVNKGLTSGKDAAKAEIIDYVTKNASLATYFQKRAETSGKDVTSLGANASIGQVDLIKPSGKLDMVSTVDPKVTAPKLIYAEEGVEPLGVLRAALEAWAQDEVLALAAMGRRAAKGSDKWDDVIIQSTYKLVVALKDHAMIGEILRQMGNAAGDLSEMKHDAHCKLTALRSLRGLPAWLRDPVLADLALTPTWTANNKIRLVIAQVGVAAAPTAIGARTKLLTELDTGGWDAKSAPDFLDVKTLNAASALPPLLTGPATDAKLIIALVGLLDHGALAPCKTYLAGFLQPPLPEIPALAKVDEVPPVPETTGKRAKVPEVPAVPGRPAAAEVPGQRPAVVLVADLPKLDELAEVTDEKATAPARVGRPGRDAVDKVAAVESYFLPTLKLKALAADRKTEAELATLVR